MTVFLLRSVAVFMPTPRCRLGRSTASRRQKHPLYLFDFASEKRGISFCLKAAVGGGADNGI
jgi:hypothetical protein